MNRWRWSRLFPSFLILPSAAAAQQPVLVPSLPTCGTFSAERVERLQQVADYFVRPRAISHLMEGGASVTYRLRFARDDYRSLEQRFPGLRETMLAAAAAAVPDVSHRFIDRWRRQVACHWDGLLSDSDLTLLADLASDTIVSDVNDPPIPFLEGDTAVSALQRAFQNLPRERLAAFERRMADFAEASAGSRLMPQIFDYSRRLQPQIQTSSANELWTVIRIAQQAANGFARERFGAESLPFPE